MSSSPDPISRPQKAPTSQPTDSLESPNRSSEEISMPSVATEESNDLDLQMRQQPIPPPSEPMQYRAIGLVRGRYTPLPDQFTQGTLVASDGTEINAVLLGRVMSLVRKHLDLEQEHLWVVYPRTREQEENLHTQIVGVWEPEKLASSPPESEDGTSDSTEEEAIATTPVEDGYFSIRGEVVYNSQDKGEVVVKIKQAPRKQGDRPKSFKLKLRGALAGKAIGNFWEFHVQRQENFLVIEEGLSIAPLPKRKPFKKGGGGGFRKGGGGGRRPYEGQRGPRSGDGSAGTPSASPRRDPLPKPMKRKNTET